MASINSLVARSWQCSVRRSSTPAAAPGALTGAVGRFMWPISRRGIVLIWSPSQWGVQSGRARRRHIGMTITCRRLESCIPITRRKVFGSVPRPVFGSSVFGFRVRVVVSGSVFQSRDGIVSVSFDEFHRWCQLQRWTAEAWRP